MNEPTKKGETQKMGKNSKAIPLSQMSSLRLKPRDWTIVNEAARILEISRAEFFRLAATEKAARIILDREGDKNFSERR